jgi:hypothetical protein
VQPGGTLASAAHEPGLREHLTLQSGMLEVSARAETQRLRVGEMARYVVDAARRSHNPGKAMAQAWLVVVVVVVHSASPAQKLPKRGELRAIAPPAAWLS